MRGWRIEDDGRTARLSRPGGAAAASAEARDAWSARPAPRDAARYRATLAHQVRQDLWRALARVRGFAPVIRVETAADGEGLRLEVAAGGALPKGSGAGGQVRAAAAALLASGAHRRRWHGHALRASGGPAR